MRRLFLVGAALWSLCSARLTPAVVLFSDSFDYANGSLISVSGGTWIHHSPASGTGEVQVISGKVFLTQTNFEDVAAQLAGQPYPSSTNVVLYAGFTINFASLPRGNGTYFAHLKDGGTSVFRDKIFATTNAVPAGFYRLGIGNVTNSADALLPANLSLNTEYVVVTRYVISNAISTLWVNPVAEGDAGATASDAAPPTTIATFALRQSLSGADGMGSLFFDNLVVATTFAEARNLSGPPLILTPPESQTATETSNVTFSVFAVGAQPLRYQWQFEGTNLAGATNATLVLNAVTTNQAGMYGVLITNLAGSTNSAPARLTVNPALVAPMILSGPQSRAVLEGGAVSFSVLATGTMPLSYQWQLNGSALASGTNSALTLLKVTTNQAGSYSVVVSNVVGWTNSAPALLSVTPAANLQLLSYLHYNVKGNGAASWSTNAAQVQAIGRQLIHLNPDVIAFNEIPHQFIYEMTNFITAFLPGYYLATNSGTDGFIRSVIASRFPIIASRKHLDAADLDPFGYTNSNFTRDLFEAEIDVPGFPQPFHAFTVHLKSGQGTDDSLKRAAEAGAISNFFAQGFLTTNPAHPYVLSGDLNEDIDNPPPSNPQSIQRLANTATGLQLTSPVNPFTGSRLTFSIQVSNGLTRRYDYILPNSLLFSDIAGSQVFRSDLITNPPPPLLTNDSVTGSDHLPVLMAFVNPYAKAFQLTSIVRSNVQLTLKWDSVAGQPYRVEASSNLTDWMVLANNLVATGGSFTFSTNLVVGSQFFRVYRVP